MIVEETELGGIKMPAGTLVTLCIGAANRDPAQFPDPEGFDVARTPNRHLAFGTGAHQCAGMALARLEGAIAISRFLKRFPNYVLDGEPVRGGRVRFRGFSACRAGATRDPMTTEQLRERWGDLLLTVLTVLLLVMMFVVAPLAGAGAVRIPGVRAAARDLPGRRRVRDVGAARSPSSPCWLRCR